MLHCFFSLLKKRRHTSVWWCTAATATTTATATATTPTSATATATATTTTTTTSTACKPLPPTLERPVLVTVRPCKQLFAKRVERNHGALSLAQISNLLTLHLVRDCPVVRHNHHVDVWRKALLVRAVHLAHATTEQVAVHRPLRRVRLHTTNTYPAARRIRLIFVAQHRQLDVLEFILPPFSENAVNVARQAFALFKLCAGNVAQPRGFRRRRVGVVPRSTSSSTTTTTTTATAATTATTCSSSSAPAASAAAVARPPRWRSELCRAKRSRRRTSQGRAAEHPADPTRLRPYRGDVGHGAGRPGTTPRTWHRSPRGHVSLFRLNTVDVFSRKTVCDQPRKLQIRFRFQTNPSFKGPVARGRALCC